MNTTAQDSSAKAEGLRVEVAELLKEGNHEKAWIRIQAHLVATQKDPILLVEAQLCAAELHLHRGQLLAARYRLDQAQYIGVPSADAERASELRRRTQLMETPLRLRYQAQNVGLGIFFDRILVCCPRCEAPGVVRRESGRYGYSGEASFACLICAFSARNVWCGPSILSGEQRCENCGRKGLSIRRRRPSSTSRVEVLPVRCPGCHATNMVPVTARPARGQGTPLDPHMGLRLLLAVHTRHGWLWALNAEHLDELRHLIAASLRLTDSSQYTWANRLPSWITAAKNRQEIVKALDGLRDLLPAGKMTAS